jgi:hypothetical protein
MTNVIADGKEGPLPLNRALLDRVTRIAFVLACLLGPACGGATTLKDVKIGIHVIDFVTNMPAGRAGIGIVYDPRIKESAEDAQLILESLSSPALHLAPGLKPQLIDVRDLDDTANLRVVMVADRMKSFYDSLAEFGRRTRTLVLSSDLDCARAGKCTVSVASTPRVEVIVSSQQAQASGIQFSEAFRMMVTEY